MLSNRKKDSFEPLEPDFQLEIEPLEDDEYTLTCMVNHGASIDGVYGASAIVRLVVTRPAAEKFANELKTQRIALTKNMEFRDYEAKPLPES